MLMWLVSVSKMDQLPSARVGETSAEVLCQSLLQSNFLWDTVIICQARDRNIFSKYTQTYWKEFDKKQASTIFS